MLIKGKVIGYDDFHIQVCTGVDWNENKMIVANVPYKHIGNSNFGFTNEWWTNEI